MPIMMPTSSSIWNAMSDVCTTLGTKPDPDGAGRNSDTFGVTEKTSSSAVDMASLSNDTRSQECNV